jgi:hypothetical protein
MAYTPKRFYIGQPGTTETMLYTVPAGKTVILKDITICNTSSTDATISLSIVPSGSTAGTANRILANLKVTANSIVDITLSQVMNEGDFLSAVQGTAGAITVVISGVEVG